MKGKAEARRVVEKPVAFKTEADLVNACEWCEQRQVELGQRVKIVPETFNPRIRAHPMAAGNIRRHPRTMGGSPSRPKARQTAWTAVGL